MSYLLGAWPALMTPCQADGSVNQVALRSLVRLLLTQPIGGLYVNGSTGEGVFMSVPERESVLDVVLDEVAEAVPVVAHVGAMAMADACQLARHAHTAGAAGFASIIPPLYADMRGVTAYYRQLAAAAPRLPFFMYLINASVPVLPLVTRLLDIPNLAGGKYTGPDMFEFRRVLDAGAGREAWSLSTGMDEMCLAGILAGSCGNIGSTLNFMPGLYARMRNLVQSGQHEAAMDLQIRGNRVTAVMIEHGFQGSLCAVMQRLGIDSGSPRLPHAALTDAEELSLHRALDQVGFDAVVAICD